MKACIMLAVALCAATNFNPGAANAQTIAGIVAASGGEFDNTPRDYDTLLTALELTGLDAVLADPEGTFTVWAPSDIAFFRTAKQLGYGGGYDEAAVWDFLVEQLTIIGGGMPIPVLESILLYHVALEEIDGAEFAMRGAMGIPVRTALLGATFQPRGRQIIDNDPDLRDGRITTPFDIEASNGIVHTVSRVLIPEDL